MACSIYSKAGTDEAISSALADSLPTTPADIGAATAAQGVLADATTVEQVTLNANLDYTLPAGVPANTIHRVVFTQTTGGHMVTYGGNAVTVDTAAGASTLVEVWPGGTLVYPGASAPAGASSAITADDTPAAPAEGASASYLVTSAVTWPAGLVWSTDPDGGVAPTITGTALVSLFTVGGITRAIMGATFPATPDTIAPSIPTGLTATATGPTTVDLAWSAATDDVGVTGYEYRIDGWAAVDAGAGTTETVTGLTAGTLYSFEVRAYDAAGNRSVAWSTAATATTSAPSAATLTYLANAQDLTMMTYYTFASQPFGTAEADRTIVVAICGFNTSSANGVSAVTIGGVAATIDAQHSVLAGNFIAIAHATVPTGTTGSVVVQVPASASRCGIALWGADAPLTPSDFDANATATATVTAPAGGMVIAAGYSVAAGAPADRIWTGITEDFDTALESRPFSGGTLVNTSAGDVTAAWNVPADANRRTAAVAYSVA